MIEGRDKFPELDMEVLALICCLLGYFIFGGHGGVWVFYLAPRIWVNEISL